MSSGVAGAPPSKEIPAEAAGQLDELVRRVASSSTMERSPRLQAFFLYVCRCALENKPEEVTEQQIGLNVYGRQPGYNPNEDNIVRSQARLLRMKLEHHFANEGKDESVVITIPKGHYLPVFETRCQEAAASLNGTGPGEEKPRQLWQILAVAAILLVFGAVGLIYLRFGSRSSASAPSVVATAPGAREMERKATDPLAPTPGRAAALAPSPGELRIAVGQTVPYVDVRGHRWDADRYYEGGAVRPGPEHLFPPVADEGVFKTMREAVSASPMVPQPEREFRYDIPLRPGVYELRLYFADPLRRPDVQSKAEDAQNERRFQVNLNGRPLLADFDPIADAGISAVDVRAFKDVQAAADGKLHLEFLSSWAARPFVSALELTPGTPGKLNPIRISTHPSDFVDDDGTRWSGDSYFIHGRTLPYVNPDSGPKVPRLYSSERHGNFSYAIPVPPGSYTVKLHFLESFFSPLIPIAACQGVGCRVFDVTCNGVMLLKDFDIVQAAPGAFVPVVREFRGLQPNGQGKLLLSFSPKVNYAEVRAIEVIDEGK